MLKAAKLPLLCYPITLTWDRFGWQVLIGKGIWDLNQQLLGYHATDQTTNLL